MNRAIEDFKRDYLLQFRTPLIGMKWFRVISSGQMFMLLLGRLSQASRFFKIVYTLIARSRGIEIDFCRGKIASGIALAHAYNITVNSNAIIGSDVILFKGCTIGGIRGGHRGGVPTIGSRVVVGLNATIVGGVKIGDDVLIAANSFVNFDVPSHSVVIGNPGVVHSKNNPCKEYFDIND